MCEQTLLDYTAWLSLGCSPRTVTDRARAIRSLGRRAQVDPCQVTTSHIIGWVGSVPGPWSRHTYWQHANSWVRSLRIAGVREDDPMATIPRPRTHRGVPRPAPADGIARAILMAGEPARMMLLLAAYAGLRVHEIAGVRGEDVTADALFVRGKGGKDAVLPTHEAIWAAAGPYSRTGWWFPSPQSAGRPVSRQTVWRHMSVALAAAGMAVTPHQLRHAYATGLLRSGTNLRVVQELMRHSSPTTTAIYTLVDDAERRTAIDRLSFFP